MLGTAKVVSEPSVLSGNSTSFQVDWNYTYMQPINEVVSNVGGFSELSKSTQDVIDIDEAIANSLTDFLVNSKTKFEGTSTIYRIFNQFKS